MTPQHKPVNLFAARCAKLARASAMRTDAMYGMEAMYGTDVSKVATERSHGNEQMDERTEIRDEINGRGVREAGMEVPSSLLAHSPSPSSGEAHSLFACAERSTSPRAHQSDQPRPDDGSRAGSSVLCGPTTTAVDTSGQKTQEPSATGTPTGTGQTAAASSAHPGISFRLKDGRSMPLSAFADESDMPDVVSSLMRQLAARFELIPENRVAADGLPGVVRLWLQPLRKGSVAQDSSRGWPSAGQRHHAPATERRTQ
jgi:hypothetical protein